METSRELVRKTVTFENPSRIPRQLWVLGAAALAHPVELKTIEERFPNDIVYPPAKNWDLPWVKGSPYKKGIYIDPWGAEWVNLQDGIIGEVKRPLIQNYDTDLEKIKIPYPVIGQDNELINDFIKTTDKFVLGGLFSLSTRMEALRGSENLLMDYAGDLDNVKQLCHIVHKFNIDFITALLETDIDGLFWGDDWGTQSSLMINPNTWREVIKPCYAEYCRMIHDAGKFVFMHSDGYIMEIYEDLIDIGLDAINSQIFCMPIEQIGQKFKGRITFWGEIDRQNLLVNASPDQIRQAVHRVWNNLADENGGVIAQLEFGLGAQPENVIAALEEWDIIKNEH